MNAQDYSAEFAKALLSLRDLGIAMEAGGNLDPEKVRHTFTPMTRKELARELHEKGLSTRDIAKIANVNHSTIVRDLADGANAPENGANAPEVLPASEQTPESPAPEESVTPKSEEPQNSGSEEFLADPIQEACEDCETAAEHWQRSLENLAGDALSVRAFWKRQFGDWQQFKASPSLIKLARRAAKEWTDVARDLAKRKGKL
jgi:hypothetical protein